MVLAVSHRPRPAFYPYPVCMGFMVHRVALGQVFLQLLLFSPALVIPQMLHTFIHSSMMVYHFRNSRPH